MIIPPQCCDKETHFLMDNKVEEIFECEDCLSLVRREKGIIGEVEGKKYIMKGSFEHQLRKFPHLRRPERRKYANT